MLDRALSGKETCILSRGARTVTLKAAIRDYKPADIAGDGGLQSGDSRVIISPTEINSAEWPDAATLANTMAGDPRIPVKGDRLTLSNGRVRVVQRHDDLGYVGAELVRIEFTIR